MDGSIKQPLMQQSSRVTSCPACADVDVKGPIIFFFKFQVSSVSTSIAQKRYCVKQSTSNITWLKSRLYTSCQQDKAKMFLNVKNSTSACLETDCTNYTRGLAKKIMVCASNKMTLSTELRKEGNGK